METAPPNSWEKFLQRSSQALQLLIAVGLSLTGIVQPGWHTPGFIAASTGLLWHLELLSSRRKLSELRIESLTRELTKASVRDHVAQSLYRTRGGSPL